MLLEFYKGVKVTPPGRDEGQWVKDLSCHNPIWHLFPLSHSALRSSSQGELHDAPPALPARPQPHDLPHSTGAPQTVNTHHPSGKNNQNPYIVQIPKKLGYLVKQNSITCQQIVCENGFTKCSWALSWAVVISCYTISFVKFFGSISLVWIFFFLASNLEYAYIYKNQWGWWGKTLNMLCCYCFQLSKRNSLLTHYILLTFF